MKTSDFDFHLPEDRIALRPVEPRDSARLMVVSPGEPTVDAVVFGLPDWLRPGDVMVFNDTRVIPARLFGVRAREGVNAGVQATLLKRLAPDRWSALAKPGKRLRVGDRLSFRVERDNASELSTLDARVAAKQADGQIELVFDLAGDGLAF